MIKKLPIVSRTSKRNLITAATVAVSVGIVGYALVATWAAGPVANIEAENGVTGNASIVSDSSASNSKAIRFGSAGSQPDPDPGGGTATFPLKVGPNNHYLVGSNGEPFTYIGDTGWAMLVQLSHEEMTEYMTTRKQQGFTVIQAAIYFDQGGMPQGSPFNGNAGSINESFFASQVDFAVAKAKELGLVLALHPVWANEGCCLTSKINAGNAQGYGEFLGNRYGPETGIIWAMGGDHPGEDEAVWRNLAKGIAIGQTGSEDYSQQIMLYHPRGNQTSATWFRGDEWMDIVASQSGHCPFRDPLTYEHVGRDYNGTPVKPVLDYEPLYESHPYCWDQGQSGYSTSLDVRKMAYWGQFAGGLGNTYGHHAVWPFVTGSHPFDGWGGGTSGTWREAIGSETANDMIHLKNLVDSRPLLLRTPDQNVITSGAGGGMEHKAAVLASDGSYLMVYNAAAGGFSVNLNKLSGSGVNAWWYNVRTGEATSVEVSKGGSVAVSPPGGGDWVFVADDASKSFGKPGS